MTASEDLTRATTGVSAGVFLSHGFGQDPRPGQLPEQGTAWPHQRPNQPAGTSSAAGDADKTSPLPFSRGPQGHQGHAASHTAQGTATRHLMAPGRRHDRSHGAWPTGTVHLCQPALPGASRLQRSECGTAARENTCNPSTLGGFLDSQST